MEQELVIKSEQEIQPFHFGKHFYFGLNWGLLVLVDQQVKSLMHQELVEQKRWISEKRFTCSTIACYCLGLKHNN
jgi:hypothetical protein